MFKKYIKRFFKVLYVFLIFSIVILIYSIVSFFKPPYTTKEVKNEFYRYLEEEYPNEEFTIKEVNHIFNESDFIHKYNAVVIGKYKGENIEFYIYSIDGIKTINDGYIREITDNILEKEFYKKAKEIFGDKLIDTNTHLKVYGEDYTSEEREEIEENALLERNPYSVLSKYSDKLQQYISIELRTYDDAEYNTLKYDPALLNKQILELQSYFKEKGIKFEGTISFTRVNGTDIKHFNDMSLGTDYSFDETNLIYIIKGDEFWK